METAVYFLIKKRIFHRVEDIWVEAQGKFAGIPGAFIRIEDPFEALLVVVGGFHDLRAPELQADPFKGKTFVESGGVKGDHPVNRLSYWGGKNLSVGDIHMSVAFDGGKPFDGKGEVRVFTGDPHPVRSFH